MSSRRSNFTRATRTRPGRGIVIPTKKQKPKNKPKTNRVPMTQVLDNKSDPGNQLASIVNNGYGKTLSMFPSCVDFARVYADPFSTASARIPILPLLPSKLVRTTVTASSVIASSGVGWVACDPEAMVSSANSVFVSAAAGGPAFFTGTWNNVQTNSSYSRTAFEYGEPTSLMMRVVATGIRVRYQGTVLNAAGDWYGLQTNPRQTVNAMSVDSVTKFPGNKTGPFRSGAWHSYCRHITSQQDFIYLQWNSETGSWVDAATGNPVTNSGGSYMGIIFSGIASQPFEYEVTCHAELVGPNLDYTGLSHPHTEDVTNVVSSFARLRHKDRTTPDNVAHIPTENKVGRVMNIIADGLETQFPILKSARNLWNTIMDK